MSDCQLSVVVPCYNEQEVLAACHRELTRVLATVGAGKIESYELVFVNDGSKDSTGDLLRALFASDPHVKVVELARNFGHQRAVSAGLEYASGQAVAIMDADLQDPPEVLLQMFDLWQKGYEVIYGVRDTRQGESWFKLATARWFYRLLNSLSERPIPEDAGDFRLLDRRYAHAHVDRLHQHNVQSIETSSLHLGLLGDMKRLNSLFCAVAYNVLDKDAQEDDDRDADDAVTLMK